MKHRLSRFLLAVPLLVCPIPAHAAVMYSITDLGTFPGGVVGANNNLSTAQAINSSGQITGEAYVSGGYLHASLYSGGTMIDLGTLGGNESFGRAINAAGQVAGNAELSGGNYHAVVYSGGVAADLGSLGGAYSLATGINGSGQVCGWAQTPASVQHAFIYSGGVMTDLGTLSHNPADTSYANGINDSGQVTGLGYINGFQQAYLYSGGIMTNLGTLGGRQSAGTAINALGQVAGDAELPDGSGHAFLYSQGKMLDLGLVPGSTYSEAFGLNDFGDVVGQSSTTQVQRAMIYSQGEMTDLNSLIDPSSGWFLLEGDGINDRGQITGYGRLNGQGHAFLLTPIVPEPSTLALGAAGVTLLLIEWRRRSTRKRPSVERGALWG